MEKFSKVSLTRAEIRLKLGKIFLNDGILSGCPPEPPAALMASTNDCYLNMDKGKYTGLIFIDLKKAFDTVDHKILLKKLKMTE